MPRIARKVERRGQAGEHEADMSKERGLQGKRLINAAIIQAAETEDSDALFATVQKHLSNMNCVNLATAIHRIAKLSTRKEFGDVKVATSNPVFGNLYDSISDRIFNHPSRPGAQHEAPRTKSRQDAMPVQCLSVIAWSCSVMQIADAALFNAIAEISCLLMDDFQAFELCQLLWSFAKIELPSDWLFQRASQRLLGRSPGEFKGMCLAMAAWAFAAANIYEVPLFESFAAELPQHAADLRPQELASTLKAYAEVGIADPTLFDALGTAAGSPAKLHGLKAHELVDIMWAFAKVDLRHPVVFSQISNALHHKMSQLTLEDHIVLLCSYASLQISGVQQTLNTLAAALTSFAAQFTAQQLLMVLEALMRLQRPRIPDRLQFLQFVPQAVFLECLSEMKLESFSRIWKAVLGLMTKSPSHLDNVGALFRREAVRRLQTSHETDRQDPALLLQLQQLMERSRPALSSSIVQAPGSSGARHTVSGSKHGSSNSTHFTGAALSELGSGSDSSNTANDKTEDPTTCGLGAFAAQSPNWITTSDHRFNGTAQAQGDISGVYNLAEVLDGLHGPFSCPWERIVCVVQFVLVEADKLITRHGSGALHAVRCSSIRVDSQINPIQLSALQGTASDGLTWLSPEERVNNIDETDLWPSLSYRIGLLLHRMVSQCKQPCPPLLVDLIATCARDGTFAVPNRQVVEASLAVLSMQASLSTRFGFNPGQIA
mmetsp:Transcript_10069/g.22258  ORF Transcript_10069/g.22258 Transcript_10069/m.22258 type:complete len:717 (+) Transcript_10069:68-2218(+)